jgi:hypothetical protein
MSHPFLYISEVRARVASGSRTLPNEYRISILSEAVKKKQKPLRDGTTILRGCG